MVSPSSDDKPLDTSSSESSYTPRLETQPPSLSQPPPPEGPPGYYPHGELKTEKGLKFHYWAFIVYILAIVLTVIMAAMLFVLVSSLVGPTPDPSAMLGAAIGTLAIVIIVFILFILVIVFWCIGLYNMHKGKGEFGEAHTRKVKLATNLFFLFLIIYLVNIFVGMFMMPMTGFGLTMSPQEYLDRQMMSTLVTGTIGLIGGIFLALHIVYLVIELSDDGHRKMLWSGFGLNLAAMIVNLVLILWLITSLYNVMSTMNLTDLVILLGGTVSAASISMVLAIIAFILFFLSYRNAYTRVIVGEIKPVAIAVTQYYYPYGYPPPPR